METTPSQIALELDQFLDSHQSISRRVEPEFIGLGDSLQALYSEAASLTDKICRAVDVIGNKETGVLANLRNRAEECLAEFRGRRQAIGDNLTAVNTIFSKVTTLINQTDALSKIGLYLRVIGLNFGVECAHVSESRAMFSLMAKEVMDLAATISGVATGVADDCLSMHHGQQDIRNRIAKDLQVMESLASDTEQAVAEAVARIETITGKAMATLTQATSHSQAISDHVGEIVMKIQLHDSMNQRIDHVVQALQKVITTLNQSDGNSADVEQGKILAGAWRIVALQCGQINRIIEEINEADAHSRTAFAAIDHSVEGLGHSFSGLQTAESDDAGLANRQQEDSLQFLQDSLAKLNRLMVDGSAMIDTLRTSAGEVSSMVARLGQHMQSIEDIRFDIQLKALNAIIKAASLGQSGRTLDVLAMETKSLADRAHDFVEEVNVVHQTIDNAVALLHTDTRENDASHLIGEKLDHCATEVSEALTRFDHDAEVCANQAGALHQSIAKASGDLAFLPRLAEELSSHHRHLQSIADSMAVWGQQLDEQELNEDAIKLMQLYTTDQERALHAAFLGIGNGEDSLATSEASPGAEDEALFFETDLSAPQQPDTIADNVELF